MNEALSFESSDYFIFATSLSFVGTLHKFHFGLLFVPIIFKKLVIDVFKILCGWTCFQWFESYVLNFLRVSQVHFKHTATKSAINVILKFLQFVATLIWVTCLMLDFILVPFDEDVKDTEVWFLDHDYLENMYGMFKKVNGMCHALVYFGYCYRYLCSI